MNNNLLGHTNYPVLYCFCWGESVVWLVVLFETGSVNIAMLFRNSLSRPVWSRMHRDPPNSASGVLGLKMCTTSTTMASIVLLLLHSNCRVELQRKEYGPQSLNTGPLCGPFANLGSRFMSTLVWFGNFILSTQRYHSATPDFTASFPAFCLCLLVKI